MATVCSSSSNHPPNLHTTTISFSTPPTKPSTFSLLPSSSFSSQNKRNLSIVSDDRTAPVTVTATAVTLANAATQVTREAVSTSSAGVNLTSIDGYKDFQYYKDYSLIPELVDWSTCVPVVRSSRGKRRKQLAFSNSSLRSKWMQEEVKEQWLFKPSGSVYLTAREEAVLSIHIKEGARLEAVKKDIWEANEAEPTFTQWAEAVGMKRRSLERALAIAKQSRERITVSYTRLVVSIAKAYQGKGLSLQDLIQEGSIGLLRGAEKFDPAKGYKLSTYVYWWIKQGIIRAIHNKSRLIRLPGSMCEVVAKIAEASTVLSRRLGRWPSYDELAEIIGVDVSVIRLASKRSRLPISLDQTPIHHKGTMTLQEIMSGTEETRPETMVQRELMKQDLHKLLKTVLNGREEIILRLYFGFNGETPKSFEEIGRNLHLSRERVRQIHYLAMNKLRQQPTTMDNLRVYIDS